MRLSEKVPYILLHTERGPHGVKIFRRSEIFVESEFFGRTELWISLSGAKFDEEADFEVRLAVAFQKTSEKGETGKFVSENFGSKIAFLANLAWFLRIYGRTDLKISFLVKFCSRLTYPKVRTSKKSRIL